MTFVARSVLAGIPGFEHGDVRLERATGPSLNNEIWRVSSGSRVWALRIGQAEDTLGQDRDQEAIATVTAAQAGVSPAVSHASNGVLLLDWIDGRTLGISDFDEVGVQRLARLLRASHVTAPPGLLTLGDTVERMLSRATARGARVPDGVEPALRRIRAAEPPAPVLTHHDIWPNNVIDDGNRLWLVDWEFAGSGDGMFDLATVAQAANLDSDGERALLEAYGATGCTRRLAEARWSIGLFEGAWALAMHTAHGSNGGFDYAEHANTMFDGLRFVPS